MSVEKRANRNTALQIKNVSTRLTKLSLIVCGDTAIVFSSEEAQLKALNNFTQIHCFQTLTLAMLAARREIRFETRRQSYTTEDMLRRVDW